jgi:hypothetical protein
LQYSCNASLTVVYLHKKALTSARYISITANSINSIIYSILRLSMYDGLFYYFFHSVYDIICFVRVPMTSHFCILPPVGFYISVLLYQDKPMGVVAIIKTCFWGKCQIHIIARTLAILHEVYVFFLSPSTPITGYYLKEALTTYFPSIYIQIRTNSAIQKTKSPSPLPLCPTSLFCDIPSTY